jgi:uncharacterized membrane protein
MADIGPVQLIAVSFPPEANFEGRIMAELAKLEGSGTIRILDLLFVSKDAESGDLLALDYQGEDLGAIVGALLGFEFDEGAQPPVPATGDGGHSFGLSREEIEATGAALQPGQSAGFLLVEHLWARDLKRAIRDAGGVPVAEGFLTPEVVAAVGGELAAMAEALDEVQAEETGTADAGEEGKE